MDPAESAYCLPVAAGKVLIIDQSQCFRILIQILLESILRPGLFQIILAPFTIGKIELSGAGIGSFFPSHVSGRIQKRNNIILILHQIFQVLFCPVADAEFKSVPDQSVKSFQAPQYDSFRLPDQFVPKIPVILAVSGTLFCRQEYLSAVESVGLVME